MTGFAPGRRFDEVMLESYRTAYPELINPRQQRVDQPHTIYQRIELRFFLQKLANRSGRVAPDTASIGCSRTARLPPTLPPRSGISGTLLAFSAREGPYPTASSRRAQSAR